MRRSVFLLLALVPGSIGSSALADFYVIPTDLILEKDQKLFPVECKLAERPDEKALQGIRKLKAFYGHDLVPKAYVACPVSAPYELASGVTAVSGWKTWKIA